MLIINFAGKIRNCEESQFNNVSTIPTKIWINKLKIKKNIVLKCIGMIDALAFLDNYPVSEYLISE